MVDREDDLRMGARSTAILFGEMDLLAQGLLYAAFAFGLLLIGQRAELGSPYWYALGLVTLLVLRQFWTARGRGREACFAAFLQNNWVGMAVFLGIAAGLALR
jgi:4-hydroxybenzoate polyprenyltransferase